MPSRREQRAAQTMLTTGILRPDTATRLTMTEAMIRRNLTNRREIKAFKSRCLEEGLRPLKNRITVVMLRGADEEGVKRTVESIRNDNPNLDFQLLPEPEGALELPQDTAALVFVANGSTAGVDRLLEETSEQTDARRIAVVLVSEHPDQTDRFDHKMSFDHAITENRLLSALNAAFYYKRGEPLLH